MRGNKSGQNLTEFVIIMVLITVVALVVLNSLGINLNTVYTKSATKYSGYEPFKFDNNKPYSITIEPGSLGGKPDAPRESCKNGSCDIDYGNFVICGIPEDFGSFVESGGTPGGTDELFNIIDQIAAQMQQKGDEQGYQDFKLIAELGHFMADIQKGYENTANNCLGQSDPQSCFSANAQTLLKPSLRDSLSEVLFSYNGLTENEDSMINIIETNILDSARNTKVMNPADFEKFKSFYPSFAMVDQYDKIMADSRYSSELKNVTTKLYKNVSDLAYNYTGQIRAYANSDNSTELERFDPIIGTSLGTQNFSKPANMQLTDILHPSTSKGTNLNSALMCVSGQNHDNGNECKNP